MIHHSIVCYHMETRVHTTTEYDSAHKCYRTRTHTTVERVNTYSETREFRFASFEDLSDDFKIDSFAKAYIRLSLTKGFECADKETLNELNSAIERIKYDNRGRDTHMEFTESFEIPGFKDIIFCKIKQTEPFCISTLWYIVWGAIFCTIPYRFYVDWNSTYKDFQIRKSISITKKFTKDELNQTVSPFERLVVEYVLVFVLNLNINIESMFIVTSCNTSFMFQ